jgi:flagellar biosynthesis/type III secretory pathway M-ring protein FliF/YscJ
VQNITFQSSPVEKLDAPTLTERMRVVSERFTGLFRYVALIALFLMIYLLILNPVKKQVLAAFEPAKALPAGTVNPALAGQSNAQSASGTPLGGGQEMLIPGAPSANPQVQRTLAMRQQVVSTVKADPEKAGQLVQNWLGEGGFS